MFKSFDRYLLKEIASPFGLGLLVYTSTLLIDRIVTLSKLFISKGVSGSSILLILLYLLPDILSFTIPMATLMGVLAGLSRLSSDSEIIACRTLGINNRHILKPVMVFSVTTWLLTSWFIMYLTPEANFRLSRMLTEVVLSQNIANVKPHVVYDRDLPYYTFFFQDINKANEWQQVFLYSEKSPDDDTLILANNGKFIHDPQSKESHIVLFNGMIHSFKKRDPGKYSITLFDQKSEKISNALPIKQTRRSTQLIIPQLLKKLRENPRDIQLRLELHNKFALPFTCLTLGLLGLALGISTKKGSKISGFTVSLGVILIYYVLITAFRNLILKGLIAPFWGMWLPNMFLLGCGIVLYRYSARGKEIHWERLIYLLSFWKRRKSGGSADSSLRQRRQPDPIKIFKILDAYILKRILGLFVLVTIALMLIFYIVTIVDLMDEIIEHRVPFSYNLIYNYYATPENLLYVLPIALLTAILLAFSLMSKNNEVIAAQVSGISLYRLAVPALLLGALFSLGGFLVQEKWLPDASLRARTYLDIIRHRRSPDDEEKHWVLGPQAQVYNYAFWEKEKNRMSGFNAFFLSDDFLLKKRISARTARWLGPSELLLTNGFEREFTGLTPYRFNAFSFLNLKINGNQSMFREQFRYSPHMSISELNRYIAYLRKNHSDTRRYEAQLFYKYAYPLSSLVMALLAIPFSFLMGNRGTLFGIGAAVGISLIYWGILGIFSSLGSVGVLSPALSAFAPLLIFISFSLLLFLSLRT